MVPFVALGTHTRRKLVTLRSVALSFSRRRQHASRSCNAILMVQLNICVCNQKKRIKQ